MDGKAKVELILQLKERVKTGLSKAKDKVERYTGDMKNRLTSLKNSHVQAFRAMRAEIPMFGRAMEILGNPYVLVAAGAIALGAALGAVTSKAADFEHEFLQIRQLNLDKPEKSLNSYRSSILDVSMDTGKAATDTAKAFYDIQSATGLFGKEVADITTKVANFSLATGAQLPDAVNQTVKAMKAFGLGVADIDRLLESNAKTVQVGITTFDELAKVQTEYAGAAAAAGQNVDTANKVFAAFTSIAKNSATAATMTKSAFEGLTQANTVKGLKAMEISLYDTNGEMRDLSAVLRDVSSEFGKMTPQAVDEIIAKIGGPEGLRNMFMKLKTDSADFFKTLEAYDNSKFNLDKALANAKNDFTTLKMIVGNQLNTVMIKLGEKILPVFAKWLQNVSLILTKVYDNWEDILAVIKTTVTVIGTIIVVWKAWTLAQWALNVAMNANPIGLLITGIAALIAYVIMAIKYWDKFGAAMLLVAGPLGVIVNIVMNIKKYWDEIVSAFKDEGLLAGLKRLGLVIIDALVYPIQQLLELIGKIPGMNFANDWARGVESFRQKVLGIDVSKGKKEEESLVDDPEGETAGNPFGSGGTTDDISPTATSGTESVSRVTASAAKVRNITVNIDSFVKGGINTENTTMQNMDAPEIERYMTDMFMRVIRNLEISGG